MIVTIESNPTKSPLLGYNRVTKTADGQRTTEEERNLTRAPGTKDTFAVRPSRRLGGYLNTGLLHEVDNDYKDQKTYKSTEWKEILKGADRISLQSLLEYKHGKEPGFYSNVVELNPNISYKGREKDISYFQKKISMLNLNDGTTKLDLSKPIEEVLYYNMKAADRVANSYAEMDSSHDYYLSSKDETAKTKQTAKRINNSALGSLEKLFESKDGTISNFCKVLEGNIARTNLSEAQAYNELDAYIRHSLKQANAFNTAYSDMEKDVIKFNLKVKIWDYTDVGIISKIKNEYIWKAPRDEEGNSREPIKWDRYSDLLDYLVSPKFQAEQELLEKQFTAKVRA